MSRNLKIATIYGFTLVELLLAVALFPIIALAAFSNFRAGAELWSSLNRELPHESVSVLYRKTRVDIDSLFKYETIPFKADEESVTFATRIRTLPALGGELGIGQVTYRYDPGTGRLFRDEKNLSVLHEERDGRVTVLLEGVENFSLAYYYFDKIANSWIWKDTWRDVKTLPVAIRFNFDYGEGDLKRDYSRVVSIQAGG